MRAFIVVMVSSYNRTTGCLLGIVFFCCWDSTAAAADAEICSLSNVGYKDAVRLPKLKRSVGLCNMGCAG